MKNLFIVLALISGQAFSLDFTRIDAETNFGQRETSPEGLAKAQKAGEMFQELANQEVESLEKANLFMMASSAFYFVGRYQSDNEGRKKWHNEGFLAAKKCTAELQEKLGTPKRTEFAEQLGNCYYWLTANKGKWAEANGIINSLKYWPEMRKTLEATIDMGQKEVVAFGPNRVLGRAYYKLPFPLGSKKKALSLHKEAFAKTLHPVYKVSTYGVNNLYFAQTLAANGKSAQAKKILNMFIKVETDGALNTFAPDRVVETREEIKEAKELLKDL